MLYLCRGRSKSGSCRRTVEDFAGNSVVRVFDRDLSDPRQRPGGNDWVVLAFGRNQAPAHQGYMSR